MLCLPIMLRALVHDQIGELWDATCPHAVSGQELLFTQYINYIPTILVGGKKGCKQDYVQEQKKTVFLELALLFSISQLCSPLCVAFILLTGLLSWGSKIMPVTSTKRRICFHTPVIFTNSGIPFAKEESNMIGSPRSPCPSPCLTQMLCNRGLIDINRLLIP